MTFVWPDVGSGPLVVIRGDVHYVQIGARTNIQDGSVLYTINPRTTQMANPLTIGEDVTVGHKAMLTAAPLAIEFC